MWLKKLSLLHFKNYEEAGAGFVPGINCLTGPNGAGKTNILDAIHYLCITRSHFNIIDSQNIFHGQDIMMIQGIFERAGEDEQISCAVKRDTKKTVKRNGKEYDKLADHIGSYPMVMIVPAAINLIYEGSEERRRAMDLMISQSDKQYLDDLMRYHKALERRNRQLKMFAEGQAFERELLLIWEKTLIECGQRIFEKRSRYMDVLQPVFRQLYQRISGGHEEASVIYRSQLASASLTDLFEEQLQRDLALQRSSSGVHKDELDFLINAYPLRKYGSQGQQKSFIISLKLAEFRYLADQLQMKPLLLLDDIFEKIDESRAHALLTMIHDQAFGQIFITDTHIERLQSVFNEQDGVSFFRIEGGKILNCQSEIQQ